MWQCAKDPPLPLSVQSWALWLRWTEETQGRAPLLQETLRAQEKLFPVSTRMANWEAGPTLNGLQYTGYIKNLMLLLFCPQEIKFHGWWRRKEMKRELRRSRNVLTQDIPQHSQVITTQLFSIKIQIWKLGVGFRSWSLLWVTMWKRHPPSSFLPLLWKKYKRPSLSALSGHYKAFAGTQLKSVYVSLSPPQPLRRSTRISILLHS